ncbi:MAG: nitroreductase family protein [Bacteroidales bacterium]|nr:nitroreductase family protein [Bacteroidales bacterium]
MMRIKQLLAVALLVASALTATTQNHNRQLSNGMEDIVLDNILARTSIRSYQDRPVEQDKIEKLLRAGMAAPSAVDKRPWHFIVVTDKQVLEGLAQANPNAGMAARAPLAIVVCGDKTKALTRVPDYWVQDASAATENILLAAQGMGLGAVWTGTYPVTDRVEKVAAVLNLPEHIIPFCTIVIGYPERGQAPKDKWDEGNISYNTFGGKKPEVIEPERTFHEFTVTEDFLLNPFNYFSQPGGMLVCAGNRDKSNAMTIGWGALGNLWGHGTNTVTVYVAEKRFTREFMENNDYFTIMTFKDRNVLRYMGTKSGRDGDKAAALGLHVAYTENGTPYYEEAECVIECKTMYSQEFAPEHFRDDVPRNFYDGFAAGYHSFYIGKIIKAMKK